MPAVACQFVAEEGADSRALVAASVVAANRACELVADHHGGPLHATAGAWAVLCAAARMEGSAPPWAKLSIVQALCNATRHISVGRKLGGDVQLPALEAPAESRLEALAQLGQAVATQCPVSAERHLIAALREGATVDELLDVLLDFAIPRNCIDDHFFLYPVFAFRTLQAVGLEHAEIVLRPMVRYLSTVAPVGRADPAAWSESFRLGTAATDSSWEPALAPDGGMVGTRQDEGLATWLLTVETAKQHGLGLPHGYPTATAQLRLRTDGSEAAASEALGKRLADTAKVGHDRAAVFHAIPGEIASALTGGGMSVEAVLNGLSLGACRLYMASEVGNPLDVHKITGIGARRYLFERPGIPTETKAFALLLWGAGFEVTQLLSEGSEGRPSYFQNDVFDAEAVPARGAAIGAAEPALSDPAAVLDAITEMLAAARTEDEIKQSVTDGFSGKPAKDGGVLSQADWRAGKFSVVRQLVGEELPMRLWPLCWLYQERGGDRTAFFERAYQFVSPVDCSPPLSVVTKQVCRWRRTITRSCTW